MAAGAAAPTARIPRSWILVASRDHVQAAVVGGFRQANHGQAAPLRRTRPGDGVLCYAPTITDRGAGMHRTSGAAAAGAARTVPACARRAAENRSQAFTAVGVVDDAPVVQADVGGGFTPWPGAVWRRAVTFAPVTPAPIAPLLAALSFTRDPRHWGAPFRFGFVEIPAVDFARIAEALGAPTRDAERRGAPARV